MEKMQVRRRISAWKPISVLLLILLLAAALVIGYLWYQNKTLTLESQIQNLTTERDSLQRELSQVKNTTEEPTGQNTPASNTYTSAKGVTIVVDSPKRGAKVTSPLTVTGKAPGNWSFEANFSVVLKNSSGAVVAQGIATMSDDWMTTEPVPFTAKLTWSTSATGNGVLVLEKSNPSGLDQHADSVEIPVTF